MKKNFENASIEIVKLNVTDIIRTSFLGIEDIFDKEDEAADSHVRLNKT